MTGQEMVLNVKVALRQLNSTMTKSYFDEEVLLALNNAQNRFVANKVRKKVGREYEYDIVDQEAIDTLLVKLPFATTDITNNSISFPRDKEYYIRGVIDTNCGRAKITILKNSMVEVVQGTPFHKSTEKNYNAELIKGQLTFFPHKNSAVVNGVEIVYIRKPKEITLTSTQGSEIESKYHQAIVDLAVVIMKVDNSQQDSQLKEQDNKLNQTLLG